MRYGMVGYWDFSIEYDIRVVRVNPLSAVLLLHNVSFEANIANLTLSLLRKNITIADVITS